MTRPTPQTAVEAWVEAWSHFRGDLRLAKPEVVAEAFLAALPEGWTLARTATAEAAALAAAPSIEALAKALHVSGIGCKPNVPFCRATHRGHATRIAAALAATSEPDHGSEYGRLLAERDRLIADGVDPADLDMPLPPPVRGGDE